MPAGSLRSETFPAAKDRAMRLSVARANAGSWFVLYRESKASQQEVIGLIKQNWQKPGWGVHYIGSETSDERDGERVPGDWVADEPSDTSGLPMLAAACLAYHLRMRLRNES